MPNSEKHQKFIEEISAPLKKKERKATARGTVGEDDRDRQSLLDMQRELERKFDELFGALEDDED